MICTIHVDVGRGGYIILCKYIRHVLTKYNKDVATDTEKQIISFRECVYCVHRTQNHYAPVGSRPKTKTGKNQKRIHI